MRAVGDNLLENEIIVCSIGSQVMLAMKSFGSDEGGVTEGDIIAFMKRTCWKAVSWELGYLQQCV